ncbi:hypothetical protein DVZ84_34345 [Streptomyces parvulus]|uniref:Uncharacterized protein n=1 Tax=Streptomyces parvulus TaxID=146923 RepID=A0A369UVZ2_9ACTN|nr:hypothetical protein DVZ84_34345 [Streptomyces parvulus]
MLRGLGWWLLVRVRLWLCRMLERWLSWLPRSFCVGRTVVRVIWRGRSSVFHGMVGIRRGVGGRF